MKFADSKIIVEYYRHDVKVIHGLNELESNKVGIIFINSNGRES